MEPQGARHVLSPVSVGMRVKGGGERERERGRGKRRPHRTNSGCGSGVGDRQGGGVKSLSTTSTSKAWYSMRRSERATNSSISWIPHGGLTPSHQKSTCLIQLTLGHYAVPIRSRNTLYLKGGRLEEENVVFDEAVREGDQLLGGNGCQRGTTDPAPWHDDTWHAIHATCRVRAGARTRHE